MHVYTHKQADTYTYIIHIMVVHIETHNGYHYVFVPTITHNGCNITNFTKSAAKTLKRSLSIIK